MAFYVSIREKGWDFDFQNFLNQEHLMARYFADLHNTMTGAENLDQTERAGLLWSCINGTLYKINAAVGNPSRMMLYRHEDLLADPHKQYEKLFERLSLCYSDKVRISLQQHQPRAIQPCPGKMFCTTFSGIRAS